MADLCLMLETSLKQVFVDETGSSATYRIKVQADVSQSEAFLAVLCEELGLMIASAHKDIEMLLVEA